MHAEEKLETAINDNRISQARYAYWIRAAQLKQLAINIGLKHFNVLKTSH